jgi:mannose-6-phosphate isomerase-like protein (cupin superfamily)
MPTTRDHIRDFLQKPYLTNPQGTIHQYQIDAAHTEFLGLIVPGGWEEFFRFVGEPFSGPLFPTNDNRNPFQVLIPKLIAASEKFDMVPVREKAQFDPQPWDGSENVLPGACEKGGYFLKADTGPKSVVGGTVVRPLATCKETAGTFSVYSVEASSYHAQSGLTQTLKFTDTHHAFQPIEGVLKIVIDGEQVRATVGETVFVPKGTPFTFEAESVAAKFYVFANGGGLGEVLMALGESYTSVVLPESADVKAWDAAKLKDLEAELAFVVV